MLKFEVTHGKRSLYFALDGNATVQQLRVELQRLTNVPSNRQTLSALQNKDLGIKLGAKNFASKLVDCGAKSDEPNKLALVGTPAKVQPSPSELSAHADVEDPNDVGSGGRNQFDWFSISTDDVLHHLIETGAVAWFAEAAEYPEHYWRAELQRLPERFFPWKTCPAICDISYVAEGLRRIYDDRRITADILPRYRSMCPLNVPLLESVLICVIMRDFIHCYRKGWTLIKVFDIVINTREFWLRSALLAFPSLASFAESAMIQHAAIDVERDYAVEQLVSPVAKDFMKRLWSECESQDSLTPDVVAELARSIHANFGADEASIEDTVICMCSLQRAFGIARRGLAECLKDIPIVDYRLTQAALDILRCSGPEEFLDSIMQKDFGIEWIRHDSAMQDAFKAAYECFKSETALDFEKLTEHIREPDKVEFFKSFCGRCSKFMHSPLVSPFVEHDVLPFLRGDLRNDSILLRVAALRWPTLVELEGAKWPLFSLNSTDERTNHLNQLAEYDCFKSSRKILERIWDTSVRLEFAEITAGICSLEPADELLAHELISIALLLQDDAAVLLARQEQDAFDENMQRDLLAEAEIHQAFYDDSDRVQTQFLLVKRGEDLLQSSVAAFQRLGSDAFSAHALVIRFEGEEDGSASNEDTFRTWMHDVSEQLFSTPLFLPVYSEAHGAEICQRLNPLPSAIGLDEAEPLLRLLGFVLALSVVRKIPIRKNLSFALANSLLPLRCRQLGLDDLQYELPEEFHKLSSLQSKSEEELDQIFCANTHDDGLHRGFTTPSRISQLCKTIDYLKKQPSPRSPRGNLGSRFLGDQPDCLQVRAGDRVPSSNVEDAGGGVVGGAKNLRGSNFKEYVGLVVNKHCVCNVRELVNHIKAAFRQIISEDKLLTDTPATLVDYWSGDTFLNDSQIVERWKKVSVFEACDEVSEFWSIVIDCKNKDLRAAIVQWSTGLRYIPIAPPPGRSNFQILRDPDGSATPTARAFGGKLGQITLPSCAVKGQLQEKLESACRDAGFL